MDAILSRSLYGTVSKNAGLIYSISKFYLESFEREALLLWHSKQTFEIIYFSR